MLVIKGTLGKVRSPSGRKGETLLPETWQWLRYSLNFLPPSPPGSIPATPPELQKAKVGTGRLKNHLLEKIGFKAIWSTWRCTSPWHLMRCVHRSWRNWWMNWLSHSWSYLRSCGILVQLPLTVKRKRNPHFKKGKKERSRVLQDSQPHLCA